MAAGPQCCTPAPASQHPCTGKEEPLGPFRCYISQPPSPKAAVILVSDVFGFDAPLFRKLADKIAACGYFVVAPDFFNGDPFVPASSGNPFATFGDWFKKHGPESVVEGTKQPIEVLKSKGFSSIGAVGFCWGAKVVVELAKEGCLNAAVLCHPSFVTVEDIQEVKTPIAILAAELDQTTPPEVVKQFAEILESKNEVESFVHIYPGVAHGWTVRYDLNNESEVKKAEEAHHKILEWLGKFLQ